MNWREAPADWRHDGIALWLLPHAPRQRGEPRARATGTRFAVTCPYASAQFAKDASIRDVLADP